jgi:hypothetical protein
MKTSKKRAPVRRPSRIVIESPPLIAEFNDEPSPLPTTKNPKAQLNGAAAKQSPSAQDRYYLRDIKIWLNKCVNFAERLEGKEAAKILRLLRETRERACRLRG